VTHTDFVEVYDNALDGANCQKLADRGATRTGTASYILSWTKARPCIAWFLWTIYLNDGFDEGETEFAYQGRKIKPKTGSLLIAPTAFIRTAVTCPRVVTSTLPSAGSCFGAPKRFMVRRRVRHRRDHAAAGTGSRHSPM